MTPKQKLEIRMSEVRQRLNEVAGLEGDAFTDDVRAEAATLTAEYQDLEVRHRASIIGEGEAEAAAVGAFADGTTDQDGAEVRSLIGRVASRTISPRLLAVSASVALPRN